MKKITTAVFLVLAVFSACGNAEISYHTEETVIEAEPPIEIQDTIEAEKIDEIEDNGELPYSIRVSEFSAWDFFVERADIGFCVEELLLENIDEILQLREIGRSQLLLTENSRVMDVAIGDLRGRGKNDIAVIVEFTSEALREEFSDSDYPLFGDLDFPLSVGTPRHIYVLFEGDDGNYFVAHRNENLILGWVGGRFAWGFGGFSIENSALHINHIYGSAWSTSTDMQFIYENGQLRLSQFTGYDFWSVGRNNQTTICDFVNFTVERTSWYNPWEENSDNLHLFSGRLPEQILLFDDVSYEEIQAHSILVFLPSHYGFLYDNIGIFPFDEPFYLNISTSEALDIAMKEFHSDFEKVIILTEENRENYLRLLSYEIPDYIYRGETGELFFSSVRQWSEGTIFSVWYHPFDKSNRVQYDIIFDIP